MDEITDNIMQEISGSDIQRIIDETLSGSSFDFSDYVGRIVNGENPFSFEDTVKFILDGIHDNIVQEKNIYIYLIIIAVMGALIANFSKLLQGKKLQKQRFIWCICYFSRCLQ